MFKALRVLNERVKAVKLSERRTERSLGLEDVAAQLPLRFPLSLDPKCEACRLIPDECKAMDSKKARIFCFLALTVSNSA